MEFSPFNKIVKLCLQGMDLEDKGQAEAAGNAFRQAWSEANNDFEKFLAAYYLARHQGQASDKLHWFQTALDFALKTDKNSIRGVLSRLYANIAACYETLNEPEQANAQTELAKSFAEESADEGPFYHGTRADLQVGALLTTGYESNYKSELLMNHIYFTAMLSGAGLAAALAKGDGRERVYIVEPSGPFENDPNVTDKKFPGNLTRSYRTAAPLKIVGEVEDWIKQMPEELQKWREKLANNKGPIIN